ncbi:hypothetical protein CEXT_366871 [Caerostris extrusa]|uniref:Uncharacterized protein n=1 Tax=Caerostris extrusa TaxID=172846 RepID=A0AAV4W564_CAEEX|nr:hypothetical protein CEXT_366871 [Caerostris extrusa]
MPMSNLAHGQFSPMSMSNLAHGRFQSLCPCVVQSHMSISNSILCPCLIQSYVHVLFSPWPVPSYVHVQFLLTLSKSYIINLKLWEGFILYFLL